jgi:hypothetical protein
MAGGGRLLAPALLSLLAACGGYRVRTDHDRQADFGAYRTFSFVPGQDPGPELLMRRVQRAVEAEMAAKGFASAPDADADLLVRYQPVMHAKPGPVFSFGVGVGSFGPGGGVGAGVSRSTGGRPDLVADIALDILDARSHSVLWHGAAENAVGPSLSPEEADAAVQKAVKDLLSGFPPGK